MIDADTRRDIEGLKIQLKSFEDEEARILKDLETLRAKKNEVKEKLKELGIPILAEDTGLNYGRTVIFDPETGDFVIKTAGKGEKVI